MSAGATGPPGLTPEERSAPLLPSVPRRSLVLPALLLLALAGPDARGGEAVGAAEGAAPAAVLDALLPEGRRTLTLEALARRVALADGEARRAEEIGRDARSSHHVLALRGGEEPHRHARHALLVVVLRGFGDMRLGEATRRVGPGSVLYVPPGAVHAFTNRAPRPAVAYAVYWPPFDGEDRQPASPSREEGG